MKNTFANSGRLAAAAVVAIAALAACGGGDDDKPTPLSVDLLVGGKSTGSPLAAGSNATLEVASGTQLEFDSTGESQWTVKADSASYKVDSFSFTEKDVTVTSIRGGTVTITFTSKEDESQVATLTITVKPKEFSSVPRKVGEIETWELDRTFVGGSKDSSSFAWEVVAVEADGSYARTYKDITHNWAPPRLTHYDAAGNTVSEESTDPASPYSCQYQDNFWEFPMQYGKSWESTWSYSCSGGVESPENTDAHVIDAYARITVPAGAYNALAMTTTTEITDSSDSNLVGGSTGTAHYTIVDRCWWAPSIGRDVKCERTYDYVGGAPSYYPSTMTWVLTAYKK